MSEILKPCPFCGGMATLTENYSRKFRMYFVFAKCSLCGAQGKTYSSDQLPSDTDWESEPCECAVNAWNTRAEDSAEHD